MRIYRDEAEKASILRAFTLLLERAPWLCEKLEEAMTNTELMQHMERLVSPYSCMLLSYMLIQF